MKMQFTEIQQEHINVMKHVVNNFIDLPIALKGGTGLLFGYNLDRFSEDLDFDANVKLNIQKRLEKVFKHNTNQYSLKLVKNTQTVQRFKVHYTKKTIEGFLKIEISYRKTFTNNDVIEKKVLGTMMKIYKVTHLFNQKIEASQFRTTARDLYDINFIINNYIHLFNTIEIQKALLFIDNINELEEKYFSAFQEDYLFDDNNLSEILINLINKKKQLQKLII